MDDRVVVTLFRHGLTLENKRKAYLGWTDSPLSDEAIQQLSACRFHPSSYDLFISSDLNRCVETMGRLFPNIKPELLSNFREMNFGAFEGKTYEELKNDKQYRKFIEKPFEIAPIGGESFRQFTKRLDLGWGNVVREMLDKGKKNPFIVTHGGVIRYLLTKYAPNEKGFWEWEVSHGKGYELHFEKGQLRRGERCTLLQAVPLMENGHG